MTTANAALKALPDTLRNELLDEYKSIIRNYAEHRWSPSELSGGRFCEIVYSILDGNAKGTYPAKASKPSDFVTACRKLESNKAVPRSFQILIPRLLPALYEVRNQRGVGHVGGAVDPNHMDATLVVSMANFVLAELIRELHSLKTDEAQQLVDAIAERRIPLVWQSGNVKRVLVTTASLEEQVLLLIASSAGAVSSADLFEWLDYENKAYFSTLLRKMHKERKVNLSKDETTVELLPPGSKEATAIVRKYEVKL
jgi:hypothetical protein